MSDDREEFADLTKIVPYNETEINSIPTIFPNQILPHSFFTSMRNANSIPSNSVMWREMFQCRRFNLPLIIVAQPRTTTCLPTANMPLGITETRSASNAGNELYSSDLSVVASKGRSTVQYNAAILEGQQAGKMNKLLENATSSNVGVTAHEASQQEFPVSQIRSELIVPCHSVSPNTSLKLLPPSSTCEKTASLAASQMYNSALEDAFDSDDNDNDAVAGAVSTKKPRFSFRADNCTLSQAYVSGLEQAYYEDDECENSFDSRRVEKLVSARSSAGSGVNCFKPQIAVWPWQTNQTVDSPAASVSVTAKFTSTLTTDDVKSNHPSSSSMSLKNEERHFNVDNEAVLREFVPPSKTKPEKSALSSVLSSGGVKRSTLQPIGEESRCSDADDEDSNNDCVAGKPGANNSTALDASSIGFCPSINLPKLLPTVPWRRQRRLGLCRPNANNNTTGK